MFANKDRVDSELEDESSALLPSTNELAELPDEDKDLIFEESKSNSIPVGLNIANTIVGSGIIGLPYAIRQAGFILGVLLLLFIPILTLFSLKILIRSGAKVRKYHYPDLFEFCFGRLGFYLMNLTLVLNSGGACVSYLIIIGDTIPTVLGYYFPETILGDRRLMTFLLAAIIIFPLTLVKNLGKLAPVSLLSVLCIPFILIAVGVQALSGPSYGDGSEVLFKFANPTFFPAIGTMAFAYVVHQGAFIHFRTLRKPTVSKWTKASSIGVTIATILSVTFGIVGYCSFGESTQGNILNNFPSDDIVINIARVFLGISLFFTFPFAFVVVRVSTNKVLNIETETKTPTPLQYYVVLVIVFAIVLVLGVFLEDLGVVYEIIGGLCSVSIAYIMPAAIFLNIFRKKWKSIQNFIVVALLIFGVVVMFASTGTVIYQLVVGE